jgi:DedD protein
MGLFSFLGKNKQDSSAEVSGRFSRSEVEAERARAKRAAGVGARREDPVLPEKKRARRRLVGAIALALAAAVGLPMLLDSEPKPLAGDIAIQIPAKDKAAPLPMPSNPTPVAASDSVDKGEEIVEPPARTAAPAARSPDARTVAPVQAKAEPAEPPPERARPEPVKAEPARPAHVEPPKPEHKDKPKLEARPEPKPEPKKLEKPARAPEDGARATAILEGKETAKAHEASGEKYVLQVAALGSQEAAAELQGRLRAAGIHSFTEKLKRPQGELIRVKVGPYGKEEADKVRAQLGKLGLSPK